MCHFGVCEESLTFTRFGRDASLLFESHVSGALVEILPPYGLQNDMLVILNRRQAECRAEHFCSCTAEA